MHQDRTKALIEAYTSLTIELKKTEPIKKKIAKN
jgi:hypothetical protein